MKIRNIIRRKSVILIPLLLAAASVRAQSLLPGPLSAPSASIPKIEVPRQLTLEKAQEILLQNNLSIIASRYGVDLARAQRLTASLRPNPTITIAAQQFDMLHPFRNVFTTDQNTAANRAYTLQYDQVLERGNKRRLRTEVADLQIKASEAQVLDTVRQQMFQLEQAFYNAMLARENLRVADENLYLIDSTEQLIKLHVSTGDSAQWDLIKFQANRVQYQRDLVSAQLSYQQSARDILNLLGARPSEVAGVIKTGSLDRIPQLLADAPVEVIGDLRAQTPAFALTDLQEAAIENRPDVTAAQRNADAAEHALQLATALRHRDVDVGWQYQRNGSDNTFGVSLSFPIFINNNHQGEISQAQAQLNQARSQLAQVKLQALTDVDKAYRAYLTSRQMLEVYTGDALSKAEESFRIAGISYKEGATSLLELQEAQRTYNQMRVASNQAHYDYAMSLFQLEMATGKKLTK